MILSVAYGIEVNDRDDRFVVTAERTMEAVDATLVPGSYLVDLIPSCEYLFLLPQIFDLIRYFSSSEVRTRVAPRSAFQSSSSDLETSCDG